MYQYFSVPPCLSLPKIFLTAYTKLKITKKRPERKERGIYNISGSPLNGIKAFIFICSMHRVQCEHQFWLPSFCKWRMWPFIECILAELLMFWNKDYLFMIFGYFKRLLPCYPSYHPRYSSLFTRNLIEMWSSCAQGQCPMSTSVGSHGMKDSHSLRKSI